MTVIKNIEGPEVALTEDELREAFPAIVGTAISEGYAPLHRVLSEAFDQAAKGKGKERHAKGRPFNRQPIIEIGRMLGSVCDGELYQVMKKTQEASNMIRRDEYERAIHELRGAIVYAAAAILLIEEELDHPSQGD